MFDVFRNGLDMMGDHLPKSKDYEAYLMYNNVDKDALRKRKEERDREWRQKTNDKRQTAPMNAANTTMSTHGALHKVFRYNAKIHGGKGTVTKLLTALWQEIYGDVEPPVPGYGPFTLPYLCCHQKFVMKQSAKANGF